MQTPDLHGPLFSRAACRVGLGADPFINVYGFSGGSGSEVIAIPAENRMGKQEEKSLTSYSPVVANVSRRAQECENFL